MPLTSQQNQRKLEAAFGDELSSTPLFPPDEQQELRQKRADLRDYLPRGVQAEIAREVECSREFVGQVLDDEDTFDRHRSDKAHAIWQSVRQHVDARQAEINIYKGIIEDLRARKEVTIKMNSTMNRFLTRRLKALEINHTVQADHGTMPITYVYKPR